MADTNIKPTDYKEYIFKVTGGGYIGTDKMTSKEVSLLIPLRGSNYYTVICGPANYSIYGTMTIVIGTNGNIFVGGNAINNGSAVCVIYAR